MTASDDLSLISNRLQTGPLAVITGAGVSTASGIPAYRDQNGQWLQSKPIQHQEFLRSEAVRRRYWARSFVGRLTMEQAEPNPGHRALADLAALGAISALITQNVDGLHQKAGSVGVIELHGGIDRVRCLRCQEIYPRSTLQGWLRLANPGFDADSERRFRVAPDGDVHLEDASYAGFSVPDCPSCGGVLKPDVVFFGDNVPRERVAHAARAIEVAAGLLVVGTSLTVYSGFRFADQAHKLGKPVYAINRGATRADPLLTGKVEADCGETLDRLLRDFAPGPFAEIYG